MDYKEYILNPSNPDSRIGAGFLVRKSSDDLFQYKTFDDYRISVVLEGSGMLIDRDMNAYPLSTGTAFQSFPGEIGTLFIDFSKPWREFQISLSAQTVNALQTLSSFHDRARAFQIEIYPHLTLWMKDIAETLPVAPKALLLENYFDLQRLVLDIHMQQENSEDAFALALIRQASVTVMKNSSNPVVISELADSFFISEARLNRIFKKYTHTTPLKYLQLLRFCYADRLLHEGKSIREVASLFGYADQFSFSKQFKRIMGISPSMTCRASPVRQNNLDNP